MIHVTRTLKMICCAYLFSTGNGKCVTQSLAGGNLCLQSTGVAECAPSVLSSAQRQFPLERKDSLKETSP